MEILYLLIILAKVHSFLQTQPTAKGLLEENLESYSKEISLLGDNLSQGVKSLDKSINAKLYNTYSAASRIFDHRIETLKFEQEKLDFKIKTQTKKLKIASDVCSSFSRCVDCTVDLNCIWCTSGVCVSGDQNGAYQGICQDFVYAKCPDQTCKDFLGCSSCVAGGCGWCDSTQECFESSASSSGSCATEYYYFSGYRACPPQSDKSGDVSLDLKYVSRNPTNSKDLYVLQLETELQELYDEYAAVEEEIDLIEFEKSQLLNDEELAEDLDIQVIDIDPIKDETSNVMQLEQEELTKSHLAQQEIVDSAVSTVINEADVFLANRTDQVIEAIMNLTDIYQSKLDKIEEDFSKSMESLNNKLDKEKEAAAAAAASKNNTTSSNSTDADVSN